MSSPLYKTHPISAPVTASVVDLPTPTSITSWWNFGFSLGVVMALQLITGLVLAMHYTSSVATAFDVVLRVTEDVNYGWWLRGVHANGASTGFVLVYLHVGRGLYFKSYQLSNVWNLGVAILAALMGIAFLGYVLPWGQMSYWGATVITNLISAVPYLGHQMVYWVWGGFSVGGATLTRFFALHYLMPFVMLSMAGLHLLMLHQSGSSTPTGHNSNLDKIPFHPYFSAKDLLAGSVVVSLLVSLSLLSPWWVGDAENFILGNPLVTPIHIKPEWYFLFAYAILRAVPNKLGGVCGLVASITILLVLPLTHNTPYSTPGLAHKATIWWMVVVFVVLSWIGGNSVESPFIIVGQVASAAYFMLFGVLALGPK